MKRMNKMKKALKYIAVLFHFTIMGIMTIILLTGAFRFAVAVIENRIPDPLEWIGMIFVGLILGCIGLGYYFLNEEDEKEIQK